ncbi:hypothetical protein FE374_09405 [Georgenia yuyongxinii]|uniref:Uncharacterized protein n=1 Tax=Georgenia yuyongxinii TaxID=2589797 RepID=A0A5B8C5Y8_9MICO|nr:hypothetical protein [Georgenia yuyongxinii]QDC24801.1 hypothetical protein FE374_09405 [Georgenia yuyongxinii]
MNFADDSVTAVLAAPDYDALESQYAQRVAAMIRDGFPPADLTRLTDAFYQRRRELFEAAL